MDKGTFVSVSGGTLDMIDDTGEVLVSVAIPAGLVPAAPYFAFDPGNTAWKLQGATFHPPRRLGGLTLPVSFTYTGANPDFQPTQASRLELQLRDQIRQAQILNTTVSARLAALASFDAMPSAPETGPDVSAVVE